MHLKQIFGAQAVPKNTKRKWGKSIIGIAVSLLLVAALMAIVLLTMDWSRVLGALVFCLVATPIAVLALNALKILGEPRNKKVKWVQRLLIFSALMFLTVTPLGDIIWTLGYFAAAGYGMYVFCHRFKWRRQYTYFQPPAGEWPDVGEGETIEVSNKVIASNSRSIM